MKKISRQSFLKLASATVMSGLAAGALASCGASSTQTAASSEAAKYTPGVYTATATGMGQIKMTATFSESAITDIQLDLSSETDSIGQAAGEELIRQCMEAQSSSIDGVSGATITTDAVKQCLNDCITQAIGGSVVSPSQTEAGQPTWRTAPDPISDSQITQTLETEVAIIGLGYAGLAAYRTLAEAGAKVLVVESMPQDSWWTVGHDIGHINSEFLKQRGVPPVDLVEFVNNWQVQTQNKSNAALVMKYAKNCGDTVDWFLEPVAQEVKDAAHITYFPDNEYTIHQLNTGYRYYTGTAQWWEDAWNGQSANNGTGLELKNLSWANQEYVEKNHSNAQVLFGTKAVQLVQEGSRVAGFVAQDSSGNYIKVLASKGVVLAGGGFGGNKEMCADLLSHIDRTFTPDESFNAVFGRDGSTIQMGVWAGGRLETDISTMNFDSMSIPDGLAGPLWVDEQGVRFQNEGAAGPELNGFFMARTRRGKIISIFDSSYSTQILRGFPGHQAFDYSDKAAVDAMLANFEAARTAGTSGTENGFFCADSLEDLASCLGYDTQQTENFLHTIEQYNEICEKGVDTDFGKDPRFLVPVKNGPFYAHLTAPSLGFALVTTGGFVTTNDQQVLDENYQPIDGLYASGNTCGMRYGTAYITPIPGVSIGMALTLGRELGKYLSAQ